MYGCPYLKLIYPIQVSSLSRNRFLLFTKDAKIRRLSKILSATNDARFNQHILQLLIPAFLHMER